MEVDIKKTKAERERVIVGMTKEEKEYEEQVEELT